MKLFTRRLILAFLLSFGFSLWTFSAPAPPPSGGPGCWPPPCIPVDGGIGLLMLAGAAYGAKKLRDSRRKSQNPA